MRLSELHPTLQALPRSEKLRPIQLMAADLAREAGVPLIETGHPHPVWSPYRAFNAADAMLWALEGEASG